MDLWTSLEMTTMDHSQVTPDTGLTSDIRVPGRQVSPAGFGDLTGTKSEGQASPYPERCAADRGTPPGDNQSGLPDAPSGADQHACAPCHFRARAGKTAIAGRLAAP